MRYSKTHKAETRRQVLETAARRFRADGIEAVGIAALMAEAGLTHGGFYAHFPSKEALVEESLTAVLAQSAETLSRLAGKSDVAGSDHEADTLRGLEKILRFYLSPTHRDRPDQGCAAASLAAEIARHAPETRAAFTESLQRVTGVIADHLPPAIAKNKHQDRARQDRARQDRAWAIFATMLGSLQLARAVSDAALSKRLLKQGIEAALILARDLHSTDAAGS